MKISITSNFDLWKLDMGAINQIGLVNASQKLMAMAQANAPYDTGKLKQGIGIDPVNIQKWTTTVRIGPRSIVYAVRREFENYKNPDRKFYMKRTSEQAPRIVTEAFQGAFKIVSEHLTK